MEVTVELKCGRCGKVEPRALSLAAAQQLSENEAQKDEALEHLPELLNQKLGPEHPDVIVVIRNSDGAYEIQTLDNLCSSPDAKRNKGCQARVQTLLDDMFMRNPKAPKKAPSKPKQKKEKKPSEKGDSE